MNRVVESPLNPRKKISLNINATILNLVKDLAELTHTNNTIIIEALLVNGIAPSIKQYNVSWLTLLGDTKDEKRKKILKGLLQRLHEISKKKEYSSLV